MKKQQRRLFFDGKDWVIETISDPWRGKYCSIRDIDGFQKQNYTFVRLRFNRLEDFLDIPIDPVHPRVKEKGR